MLNKDRVQESLPFGCAAPVVDEEEDEALLVLFSFKARARLVLKDFFALPPPPLQRPFTGDESLVVPLFNGVLLPLPLWGDCSDPLPSTVAAAALLSEGSHMWCS